MVQKLTKDADAILAQELNQLSIKEREELLYDIHGVLELPKEEPKFIANCLEELDKEIYAYSHSDKNAYELAQIQNDGYVSNHKFRLKFLRAETFNPSLAAQRLIKFFASKLQLFGPDYLTKDIRLEDLSEDDKKCMESGILQLLPLRDRAGRAIICWVSAVPGSDISRMRALFYGCMCASEDEETQQRGLAVVAIAGNGQGSKHRLESARSIPPLISALPVRMVAIHFCIETFAFGLAPIFNAAIAAFGKHLQVRVRAHHGSMLECKYELMTFGIPTKVLPINADGEIDLDHHSRWLQRRRILEATNIEDSEYHTNVPNLSDVLFGKEKSVQEHSGNIRYLNLIAEFWDRYDGAKKIEKKSITGEMVDLVKKSGGRFLKMDDFGWVEVSDIIAREKVSNAFRDRRKAVNRAQARAVKSQSGNRERDAGPASSDCSSSIEFQPDDIRTSKRLRSVPSP